MFVNVLFYAAIQLIALRSCQGFKVVFFITFFKRLSNFIVLFKQTLN